MVYQLVHHTHTPEETMTRYDRTTKAQRNEAEVHEWNLRHQKSSQYLMAEKCSPHIGPTATPKGELMTGVPLVIPMRPTIRGREADGASIKGDGRMISEFRKRSRRNYR